MKHFTCHLQYICLFLYEIVLIVINQINLLSSFNSICDIISIKTMWQHFAVVFDAYKIQYQIVLLYWQYWQFM